MDKTLASVLIPGKMTWATAMRSIWKCKIQIEKIGGSQPIAWGLDAHIWNLLWTGDHVKRRVKLKDGSFESVEDLKGLDQMHIKKYK